MQGNLGRILQKLVAGTLTAFLTTSLATSLAGADPVSMRPAPAPSAARAVKVDRDGNKVFDELDPRLRRGSPADRLNVIVVLRAPASAGRVRRLERSVGDFATERRFSIIDGFSAKVTKRQARALARDPAVDHVEANSTVRALNDTAQSSFGVTKARIDAPALDGNADGSVATYSKDDLVVAIIDTGIDANHLDLDDGKVIAFRDFVGGGSTPYDDQGHGTHVAAIAAGEGDARADRLYRGVAPGAALVGVKILDSSGFGTESNLVAGIQWVAANKATYGIEVANLSLGFPGCSDGADASSQAVNAANDAGLVMSIAAGNEGPGRCTINSPGAAAKALTVGGMADLGENGFNQYVYSSRGKTLDGRIKPDISAPGIDITSARAGTTNGYINYTGTSMATPFVAGVSLLMLDANPGLTTQQVKDKITGSAVDWGRGGDNLTAGSTGADVDYGAGRLDAYAALKSAGAALNAPPLVPAHELREGTLSGTGAQVDYPLAVMDTQFPISATMIMPTVTAGTTSNPDLDLFLFDPNGNQVASSEFTTRQEELGYNPTTTGTYTLRVKSFRGSASYFVDVSIGRTGYARPQAATPTTIRLVPAFEPCGAPNGSHGAPLAEPSCSPPTQTSHYLTVGTPDVNGKAANSTGLVKLTVVGESPINPNNGDQADVQLTAQLTDVRKLSDLSDYTGQLRGAAGLRITDRLNGADLSTPATASDLDLGFTISCASTPDPAIGGSCNLTTSVDTLTGGTAVEGKRAVWALRHIELYDGGADGIGSTIGDNTLFATQGLFAP
jgi:serine protease AprX